MATKVQRRRVISDWVQKSQMYLFHRHEVKQLETPRDNEKKWLKQWLSENGVTDPETGNINAEFEKPLDIYGKTFYGMQLRRIPGGEFFDKDEVLDFLEGEVGPETGLMSSDIKKVFRTVKTIVFDQDELYVLQQEGKISEESLRKLLHEADATYQLWPIDTPLPDNDDD